MSKKGFRLGDFLDDEAVDVNATLEDRDEEYEKEQEDEDVGSFIDDEETENTWSPKMVGEENDNAEEIGMEGTEESDEVVTEESDEGEEVEETVTPPPPPLPSLRESSRVFIDDSGDESDVSQEPRHKKTRIGTNDDDAISEINGKLLNVPGASLTEYKSGDGRKVIKGINARHSRTRNRRRISSSSSSEDEVFPRSTVELIEDEDEVFPRSAVELIEDEDDVQPSTQEPGIHTSEPRTRPRIPRSPSPDLEETGGRNREDNEGERRENYLSGIEEASKEKVEPERNGRIEVNFPIPGGIVSREFYIEMLAKLSKLLKGRSANLHFEAGLLLESSVNKQLRHFYASENTDVFRRRVPYDDDTINDVLEILLSADFSEICENVKEDSDWRFLNKYLIGKHYLSGQSETDSFFACIATFEICQEKFDGKLQFVQRYKNKTKGVRKYVLNKIPKIANADGSVELELLTSLCLILERDVRIWDPRTRAISRSGDITPHQVLEWKKINLEFCPRKETFSLIKSTKAYRNVISCQFCTQRFKRIENKIAHLKGLRCPFKKWRKGNNEAPRSEYFNLKTKNGKLTFCQGIYKPKQTILESLSENGVITESERITLSKKLLNPYLAVFDIESYLSKMDHDPKLNRTSSIEYQEKHDCMSISVCSNVPSFQRVQTLVAKEPGSDIAKEFLHHLYRICDEVEDINHKKHGILMRKIIELEKQSKGWKAKQLKNLRKRLLRSLGELVVLGWNSTRYDLPVLIRSMGLAYWIDTLEGNPPMVLRKGPKEYLSVMTQRLKFLDLLNFLGTKTSLRKYLRQMKIPEAMGKMMFPYTFVSDHKKLFQSEFPPYESFYSDISQCNVLEEDWSQYKEQIDKGLSEEEALKVLGLAEKPKTGKETYREVKKEYEYLECKYLWQYLAAYNSMDVLPLIPCSEQLCQRYFELTGLDCFSYTTISSMAFPFLVRQAYESNDEDWNFFCMLNEEAHEIVANSVMGGLSHCFNKLGLVGYTKLEPHRFPPDQREKCKQIATWDANMMYSGTAGLICSNVVGHFSIRRKEEGFCQNSVAGKQKLELIWLKVEEIRRFRGKKIRTALGPYGQKTLGLGSCSHKVDGYIWWWKQGWIVLEFDGCLHHGCPFCYPNRLDVHPLNGKTFQQLHNETERRNEEIKKLEDVTELIVMRECVFNEQIRTNYKGTRDLVKKVRDSTAFPPTIEENITWERMSELLIEEKISGFVECSMKVPETAEMYEKFSTFPPFFDKEKLNREDLADEKQKNYATNNGLLKNKQTYLLSKMGVENVKMSTSLFVFYVKELGLEVTDITRVLQFRRAPVMKKWLDMIIAGRKEAKAKNEETLTLAYKALGNHGYGFGLLNLLDRSEVKYVKPNETEKFDKRENSRGYYECGPEGDRSLYLEFAIKKKSVRQELPKQLSADILSCAKIPLLQCVYGMFDKYFRRSAWSLLAMDTDSVMVMLAGDTMAECCKPELRAEFEARQDTFFVPLEGTKAKELALEPLLFKQEFRADIAVTLAPKSYLCINLKELQRKMATKGFRRSAENEEILKFESFFKTLFEGQVENEPSKAVVRGMRTQKDGQMYTYKQKKRGLTKLSPKFGYCDGEIHYFPREILSSDGNASVKSPFSFECDDNPEEIWEFVSKMVKDLSPAAKQFIFGAGSSDI